METKRKATAIPLSDFSPHYRNNDHNRKFVRACPTLGCHSPGYAFPLPTPIMKNTKKDSALWGTITFYGSALLISLIMLPMVARPITQVGATVASNPGNSLSGMNDGFVNRYNS